MNEEVNAWIENRVDVPYAPKRDLIVVINLIKNQAS